VLLIALLPARLQSACSFASASSTPAHVARKSVRCASVGHSVAMAAAAFPHATAQRDLEHLVHGLVVNEVRHPALERLKRLVVAARGHQRRARPHAPATPQRRGVTHTNLGSNARQARGAEGSAPRGGAVWARAAPLADESLELASHSAEPRGRRAVALRPLWNEAVQNLPPQAQPITEKPTHQPKIEKCMNQPNREKCMYARGLVRRKAG
jgi:hypothetical protein